MDFHSQRESPRPKDSAFVIPKAIHYPHSPDTPHPSNLSTAPWGLAQELETRTNVLDILSTEIIFPYRLPNLSFSTSVSMTQSFKPILRLLLLFPGVLPMGIRKHHTFPPDQIQQ
jgi:hypothetical protein